MAHTTLVWFRDDLRLHDNPALAHAVASSDRVIPVYLHSPAEAGDWQAGAASNWWLHHSLAELAAALEQRGSRLVIEQGPSALPLLQQLIETTGAEAGSIGTSEPVSPQMRLTPCPISSFKSPFKNLTPSPLSKSFN